MASSPRRRNRADEFALGDLNQRIDRFFDARSDHQGLSLFEPSQGAD
jgi:hypothetical protein